MNERGQSTVEIVAITPLLMLCCLVGLQALVAGANFVAAENAAHAGALAGQLGRDPETAARRAAPGWPTARAEIRVSGREVRVKLKPRALIPGVNRLLTASAGARFTRP